MSDLRRPLRGRATRELLLSVTTLAALLVLLELGLRLVLFGDLPAPAKLRDPWLYADYFSEDDYWILQHRLGSGPRPPRRPHPLLGWVGRFSRDDFRHQATASLGDRRPVLLYGDSYSQCVGDVQCFEDILNADPDFAQHHFLLNYGVGGYGLDQIYLLLERSLEHYRNPFVVVGLMTLDLDRTILSVRTGQKPRFVVEGSGLRLTGVPIDPDPEAFFARHPPGIRSYLARLVGRTFQRFLPPLGRNRRAESHKRAVSRLLIEQIQQVLRERSLDHLFVIFHPQWAGVSTLDGPDDWRDEFLRQVLEERKLPFVWTKDLLRADREARALSWNDYIDPDNGHPTTRYNRLVAAEIRSRVLSAGEAPAARPANPGDGHHDRFPAGAR